MRVDEIIVALKNYYFGKDKFGNVIDDKNSRDQVLFGDPDQECTGIVITCWASMDVIEQAISNKANLIICHEALFWNHGDHQGWLEKSQNETYLKKKALLKSNHIVVWRNHDYIHSGIPTKDKAYTDGIFYGMMNELNWKEYLISGFGINRTVLFNIPPIGIKGLAETLIRKFDTNGARVIGNSDQFVSTVLFCSHIDSRQDNSLIEFVEKNNIDVLIPFEMIDFTASEYVYDSSVLNRSKAIISLGHFNLEEAGMKYMLSYLPEIIGKNVHVSYVKSKDMYNYVTL